MAFHLRKLLKETDLKVKDKNQDFEKYCTSCDDCSDYCKNVLPPIHHKHQISTILIISLSILGAGFLFLTYFGIRRFRSRTRPPPLPENSFREIIVDELQARGIDHPAWYIRTMGLPQSAIDSIHKFNYKKGEKLIEGSSDCAVCLSEFEEGESLRVLPNCSHAFHVSCIDTWFRSHKNCPVCRALMMIVDGDGESTEETSSGDSESTVEIDEGSNDVEVREAGDQFWWERGFRVASDLADHDVKVDQELRRSVSLDLSSASRVYEHVANVHCKKDEGPCDNNAIV